ncbi:MAG: PIN domain-containing protein [Gammaproteobacteria bacterium]|nr:PIN domain-containing protein [Gammaproteobacteria bacterium]
MYLADTSAWIEYTRPKPRRVGLLLRDFLKADTAVFVAGVIVQELLQGARDELQCRRLGNWLQPQRWVAPTDDFTTHAEAGRLYARCRWQGFTPRSSNDCLIAQLAIEHDLVLLHDDAEFEEIARIEPRLRLA